VELGNAGCAEAISGIMVRGKRLRTGVVVFGLKSTFHSLWKQVGPTGGRQPGMVMNH
jgi:hypothetical protein